MYIFCGRGFFQGCYVIARQIHRWPALIDQIWLKKDRRTKSSGP